MAESFFPNQPPDIMRQERRLRAIAAELPEQLRLELYQMLSAWIPSFEPTSFRIDKDMAIAAQAGREIAFPRPVPLVKLNLIAFGYEEWLRRKYCLPGFVEVRPGDIVVDCGAYVGGFSLSAARIAGMVHAFEPDRHNAVCARRNLSAFANVRLVECGLHDRSGEMILNISSSNVEHSMLPPDDGAVVEQRIISTASLADYARTNGIEAFDFVKIEAEGVELEVFAGLEELRPSQLAIDVSPERNGVSPASEFRAILEPLGYEVRQRGQVMFALLRR